MFAMQGAADYISAQNPGIIQHLSDSINVSNNGLQNQYCSVITYGA